MKSVCMYVLTATAVAVFANSGVAATFDLSGSLDPLQAGTNGGFGASDSTVVGAGAGTGTIVGNYDDVTNLLNYTITWQDLTSDVTNMHFHLSAPGSSGGVELPITGPWASPYVGTSTVDALKEPNLLGGDWYVNVHTSNFGGGEIRGQVNASPVPEPTGLLLLGLGLLAIRPTIAGRRRFAGV